MGVSVVRRVGPGVPHDSRSRGSTASSPRSSSACLLREWYMHPNGQIPAYEFAFGDVNPPVHAWAAGASTKSPAARTSATAISSRAFFKSCCSISPGGSTARTPDGKNLFAGGFLGLDNIGVFDRSKPLPDGGTLRQADGTAWMAFYCVTMLAMALELARDGGKSPAYEDMASKFFEHFVQIADAMNTLGGTGLWDEARRFLLRPDQDRRRTSSRCKSRSLVGLLPLIAVEVLEEDNDQDACRVSTSACSGSSTTPPGPRASTFRHCEARQCDHGTALPAGHSLARTAEARAALRAR